PSSTIRYGLVLLAGSSSWLFLYPWVTWVVLPFYRRLNARTAYEFLEARFDVRVRILAAAIFVIWRLGWMATAIYVPCLVIAVVVAIVVGRMAGYTSDQVMVQRFQTTRSLSDARRAFVVNAAGDVLWMFGLSFVGLVLLAYFTHVPLPPEYASDKILPYFMSQVFPAGAVGLVVAAILAASLSSIDSAINSSTSVVVVDFYNRLFVPGEAAADGPRQVLVSRVTTVIFGLAGT